jgi:collagen type III alpha
VVTRLPLCEDMLGETTVAGGTNPTGGGTTPTGGGTTPTGGGTTPTGTTTPTTVGGFTTPITPTAAATTPITGGILGGVAAPASTASTGTPATGGIGGVGGAASGTAANTPSAAKGGGSASGAAANPAAGANPAGVPVPGTTGLFATSGQDPSGPMTAKVTRINQTGLPRIAFDSAPAPIPTFVAARSPMPTIPTLPDATASVAPSTAAGKNLTSNTKTRSRASIGVRHNGKLALSAAGSSNR